MEIVYLTTTEAIYLNGVMIEMYSPLEESGVKDMNMLEASLERPKQSAFLEDAYPTIFHKASALVESMAQNHAFFNANKRTALACLQMFLDYNGYDLDMTYQEASDFVVDVVNHKLPFDAIVATLEAKIIPVP